MKQDNNIQLLVTARSNVANITEVLNALHECLSNEALSKLDGAELLEKIRTIVI